MLDDNPRFGISVALHSGVTTLFAQYMAVSMEMEPEVFYSMWIRISGGCLSYIHLLSQIRPCEARSNKPMQRVVEAGISRHGRTTQKDSERDTNGDTRKSGKHNNSLWDAPTQSKEKFIDETERGK